MIKKLLPLLLMTAPLLGAADPSIENINTNTNTNLQAQSQIQIPIQSQTSNPVQSQILNPSINNPSNSISGSSAGNSLNIGGGGKSWTWVQPPYAPYEPENGPMHHGDPWGGNSSVAKFERHLENLKAENRQIRNHRFKGLEQHRDDLVNSPKINTRGPTAKNWRVPTYINGKHVGNTYWVAGNPPARWDISGPKDTYLME